MRSFNFHSPETISEVLELLAQYGDEAKLMGGGTALTTMMKQSLVQPAHVVSLHKIGDYREIKVENDLLRFGAFVTHRQVERSELVKEHAPLLASTYKQVATVRIRNSATVGGGLAHADPSQDPQPSLLVLDAQVRVRSSLGERLIPLEKFCSDYYETDLQPNELITEVIVPINPKFSKGVYLKYLPRTQDDYATVSVAALGTVKSGFIENVRVALGSVGAVPIRAQMVEKMLVGQTVSSDLLEKASNQVRSIVDPLDDARGSAEYKIDMAVVFTKRALGTVLDVRS
tara:strand:+ start:969 stop:1829 length:861 start_codon:yes stop_codon:yes gene_type:complete